MQRQSSTGPAIAWLSRLTSADVAGFRGAGDLFWRDAVGAFIAPGLSDEIVELNDHHGADE
jgi:hypothetical protein